MEIIINSSYLEASKKVAELIGKEVIVKKDSLLSFPSGDTPVETLKYLVEMSKEGTVDFSNCYFVGLDEWVGLRKEDEGSCKNFIYTKLFEPLGIEASKIEFFDACSEQLETECKKVDEFINKHGSIDVMFVGLGMNGHIGLNEPGISFDLYSHVVDLHPTTRIVGQKYFKTRRLLEKGITLGMKHLMEAKCVIMMANGIKKAEIVKKIIDREVSADIPATILKQHKNCFLFLDSEAASLLKI